MRAGNSMPWYAIAFSIMATQASAITFISTTGQSYVDGMRFVQFYFGLPIAMIILSFTLVPLFHRAKVYTAYEYLEKRFDAKTRAIASIVFLIERGLAIGIALYAVSIVLSIILGWPEQITIFIVGILAVLYTTFGGVVSVTWTEFPQMIVMTFGLVGALIAAFLLLPHGVSPLGAVKIAAYDCEAIQLERSLQRLERCVRRNVSWRSHISDGDQSQVQRYLTGRSLRDSRLSLLFNGIAKIPLQMFILFIGAIVFSFYNFSKPPVVFDETALHRIQSAAPEVHTQYQNIMQRYDAAFEQRKLAATSLAQSNPSSLDPPAAATQAYQQAETQFEACHGVRDAIDWQKKTNGGQFNDTNFIFLTFVTRYLPAGIVGLIMATIIGAAMASVSSEINSLATVTVIDIYKRHFRKNASDHHYVRAAKVASGGILGCLCGHHGRLRQKSRIANRSHQYSWIVVLRGTAGSICARRD